MRIRDIIELSSTIVVALAAVAMVGMALAKRSSPPSVLGMELDGEDWARLTETGIRIGPPDANLEIVGFLDFTCPYCGNVGAVFDTLLARYPQNAAFVFQHFPLRNHQWAMPAAIAGECAARQDRFFEMAMGMFGRAVLDSSMWTPLAKAAGVGDISAFEECLDYPEDSFPRIKEGRDLGAEFGVTGTPSLWLNGRTFNGRRVEQFEAAALDLGVSLPVTAPGVDTIR